RMPHAGVYRSTEFPFGTYGSDEPTIAMTVPNYLVTAEDVPDALVRDVLAELFAARPEIVRHVPAAALLDRRLAIFTDPVPLHPGAEDYYRQSRRSAPRPSDHRTLKKHSRDWFACRSVHSLNGSAESMASTDRIALP